MANLNFADFQDVLGQLPRLKTYTHVLLGFPLRSDQSLTTVLISLETSVGALVNAFPWIAFRVVHEGSSSNNSGIFKLEKCTEFAAPDTLLQIKDCTDQCSTYKEIVDSYGPVSMLDGNILSSLPAFPRVYDDRELNPAPVFSLQVNLVLGGLLLDVAAQHNFIDGGGLMRLLGLLAKSMQGDPFSVEEIEHGNRDRSNLFPLLGPDEPMLDHSHLIRESLLNNRPLLDQPEAHWGFVRFPAPKVEMLKIRANKDIQHTLGSFVSTNDALSSFIWRCISAVRLKRGQNPDDFSRFSRALDARRAVRIPREYLGQMGYNATCRLTFHDLQTLSLGEVALFMRRAAEKVNTEYSVRSWATFVAREPDKSKIMFGGSFDPEKDVGMSSLIHASVHGFEFGILGKPDLVRRPNFLPLESCIYLWTQTVNHDVDVLSCLKSEDWDELRASTEWTEYTDFVG